MAYPTVEKINSIFEDHSPLSGIWESSSFFMAVDEWDSMAGVAEVTVGPLLLDEAGRRPLDSPSSSPPNRSLLDLDFSDISAMTIQHHLRFSTIQDPTTGDGLYIWVSKQIKMVFKLELNQLNFELCQLSATVSYENIGGYNIEPAAAATIIRAKAGIVWECAKLGLCMSRWTWCLGLRMTFTLIIEMNSFRWALLQSLQEKSKYQYI